MCLRDRCGGPTLLISALCLWAGCTSPAPTKGITFGAGGADRTAVYSRASKDYVRVQNPDGSFQPETYELKNGGNFGGPRTDVTMDLMSFDDVARVIAKPLAEQNYLPSHDHESTNLVIIVFWGTTIVPNDVMPYDARPSAQYSQRAQQAGSIKKVVGESGVAAQAAVEAEAYSQAEQAIDAPINAKNANILGYTEEILRTSNRDANMATLQDEVKNDRYYVVLLAYDFQFGRKFGLRKLVWETRFSIPEPGNDFAKAFPSMASIAGKYFGQDSHGLVHHNLGDTHVEIGEPKSLGTLPDK